MAPKDLIPFGVALGFCYAFAETVLLGLCGISLDINVIIIDILLYPVICLIVLTVLISILRFLGYRLPEKFSARIKEFSSWPGFFPVALVELSAIVMIYAIFVLWLKGFKHLDFKVALEALLPFLAATGGILFLWHKGDKSSLKAFVAITGVSFATIGSLVYPLLTFRSSHGTELSSFQYVLLLPVFVCLIILALGALKTRTRSARPVFKTKPYIIITLSSLALILDLTLWLTVFPIRNSWLVVERKQESSIVVKDRPNILLVVFDTVRADHLELFGYHRRTMPYLTEFVRRTGAFYKKIRSPAPHTLPSHISIFTGTYPSTHRARLPLYNEKNSSPTVRPFDGELTTLAEKLGNLGYQTAGISSNCVFMIPSFGVDRGFQFYDSRPNSFYWNRKFSALWSVIDRLINGAITQKIRFPKFLNDEVSLIASWYWLKTTCRRAPVINDEIFHWLARKRSGNRPFFLFVNYMEAHAPYLPPGKFKTLFTDKDKPVSHYHILMSKVKNSESAGELSTELKQLVDLYDGELSYLDYQFKTLIDSLSNLGVLKNTVVIVTSDHGEAFGEHGEFNHGGTLYEEEINVPFIIKYPDELMDKTSPFGEYFQHVDVFPTIMELLDEDLPAEIEGYAFGTSHDYMISERFANKGIPRHNRELTSLFHSNYKYIHSYPGESELYDLNEDPGEKNNILQKNKKLLEFMDQKLKSWKKDHTGESRPQSESKTPDQETLERLKALGYIQ